MHKELLEPITRYVEAVAHLAALQAIGPVNAERRRQINDAARNANRALVALETALIVAEANQIERETAIFNAITQLIDRRIADALEANKQ